MRQLTKVTFALIAFFFYSTLSYGQFFNGYVITSEGDSVVSNFQFDKINNVIIDKDQNVTYSHKGIMLVYDSDDHKYYKPFEAQSSDDFLLYQVFEEGEMSMYALDKEFLLIKNGDKNYFKGEYGKYKRGYTNFLGSLNIVFNGQLQTKDFEDLIDSEGRVDKNRILKLVKSFNGDNYNSRFREKSKVKPKFFIGGGPSSLIFSKIAFENKPRINVTPGFGYNIYSRVIIKKGFAGIGYNSVGGNVEEGTYNLEYVQGKEYYQWVMNDVGINTSRFFLNLGYNVALGRVSLQTYVQWNFTTFTIKDSLTISRMQSEISYHKTMEMDPVKLTGNTFGAGLNLSYAINKKSYIDLELVSDVSNFVYKNEAEDHVIRFFTQGILHLRYSYLIY